MQMDQPPFITKILPPRRREDILHRTRLVDFIHEHIDRRLLLLSAPAGFGKTTLLVDFASDSEIPVCWYTIDASDSDPRVFLEYVIQSIHRQFPDFGQRTYALLHSVTDMAREMNLIVGSLVNEILAAVPEYFLLVLDDFHLLDESKAISDILDLFLRYIPDNCHIILSSRTIPRITMTRLAAHRQIAGIGTTDLRFSPHEVKSFMNQNHKLLMTDQQADEMAKYSEGWITGIILTTHTMWRGLLESIVKAKGSNGPVFDYLALEVFDQQNPEIKDFLLGSSVISLMSADTCDHILARTDSEQILALLDESNLFTTRLDEERTWYKYHSLFQQFLTMKLRQEMPQRFTTLHANAGALFESQRNFQFAIDHYLAADLDGDAARLIEPVAEDEINRGRFETAERWLLSLPEEQLRFRPKLLIQKVRIALHNGKLDEALAILNNEQYLVGLDDVAIAEMLVWRSTTKRLKGSVKEARDDSRRAIILTQDSGQQAGAAHQELGISSSLEGDYRESIIHLEKALDLLQESLDRYKVASLHHSIGEVFVASGEYDKALEHFLRALDNWKANGNIAWIAFTLNSIGVLHYLKGEFSLALDTLDMALENARKAGHLRVEAYTLASLSDLYRDQGFYQQSIDVGQQALDLARRVEEGTLVSYCLDALGTTHSYTEDFTGAETMITQAIQLAEQRESKLEIGTYKSSLGRLFVRMGQPEKAIPLLTDALERLRNTTSKRQRALVHLFLACALLSSKRTQDALEHLDQCLETVDSSGLQRLFQVHSNEVRPLVTLARASGKENSNISGLSAVLNGEPLRKKGQVIQRPAFRIARSRRAAIKACAFGHSTVHRGDEIVSNSDWAVEKTKEMFFYFALTAPKLHRKEQIIEVLWPEIDDSRGNSQFHSTAYRLRRALAPDVLVYNNGLYTIELGDEDWLDVSDFELAIAEAKKHPKRNSESIALLSRAVNLYKGPLLEDIYSDWCQDYRTRLERDYLESLHVLAAWMAENGDSHQAIEYCEKALSVDYYHEDTHIQLWRLYAITGDRLSAIKHYRKYVEFLEQELGIVPSPQTVARFEELMFKT